MLFSSYDLYFNKKYSLLPHLSLHLPFSLSLSNFSLSFFLNLSLSLSLASSLSISLSLYLSLSLSLSHKHTHTHTHTFQRAKLSHYAKVEFYQWNAKWKFLGNQKLLCRIKTGVISSCEWLAWSPSTARKSFEPAETRSNEKWCSIQCRYTWLSPSSLCVPRFYCWPKLVSSL